ncbi:unnamed protein product [Paramecium octaurelia]|uniref:2-hydroxyacyl-CoA lyase n=1 Tax=Paramecium octaurelia TaxID=43137 RepID=A0A8S1YQ19_PAROT|nr:unnamed protein product [Paramecium octaurelia]
MISGNQVIAQSFAQNHLKYVFGIVGVPVIELGYAFQAQGMEYYGFRNEQGASYACGAIGYLTRLPAICLVVSGPGLVHALAGAANAQVNGWPMVIVAGSSENGQQSYGAFQECDQWNIVKPYIKFGAKITNLRQAPILIEKAIRQSCVGRPGVTYIEVSGDLLRSNIPENELIKVPSFTLEQIPKCLADPKNILQAVEQLKNAKRPLVIVGKGASISLAEEQVIKFIESTKLPFLPSPMGKGVVPDSNPLNVSAARSTALGEADVILLVGARLNWILHFGLPPRFDDNCQFIQIDNLPEEFNNNRRTTTLFGDVTLVVDQLQKSFGNWQFSNKQWIDKLFEKRNKNTLLNQQLMNDKELPLEYYSAFGIIKQYLPRDCVYVGEGANTMDVGRTIIEHDLPRRKLDSGTFGTMGIGLPFAIASKLVFRDKQVFAILGDSAFGFSGFEFETSTRYNLPLVIIIINNNGIFVGVDELSQKNNEKPVTALNPNSRYEKLCESFGGKGFLAETHDQLHSAMKEILSNPQQSYIVNVRINPYGQKKPQEHAWLTQSKL